MLGEGIQLVVVAWLLTYALHSTLLLGAAWLLTSWRRVRSARVEEILWRTALLGGVFTATMQLALEYEPSGGRWSLTARGDRAAAVVRDVEDPGAGTETANVGLLAAAPRTSGTTEEAASPAVGTGSAGIVPGGLRWTDWALFGWAFGGVVLLSLLAMALHRLRRHLTSRRPLSEGPLPALLEDLRHGAGFGRRVRLTVSPRIEAPVALGTFTPEICLPPRAVTDLPRDLQRSMLAHELAHLARHDPFWLDLGRLLETLFFFQPLNRLARRRLSECAELCCDDWAVGQTGDPVGLARCLAEVARWLVGETEPLHACAMADLRSPLGERVERILDEERRAEAAPGWLSPLGASLLSATVMLAPGFAAPPASPVLPAPGGTPGEASAAEAGVAGVAAPAADLFAVLTPYWSTVSHELDALESEIAALRSELRTRAVDRDTLAALERIDRRARELRDKEGKISSLLELWEEWAGRPEPVDAR